MNAEEYIHYGASHYVPSRFDSVKNRKYANKPFGGLWASAANSTFGWKEWNEASGYGECDEDNNSFRFCIAASSRVLIIDSVEKALQLPTRDVDDDEKNLFKIFPDFEEICKHFDVIDVRLASNHKLQHMLDGWDCDTILVLNQDVIRPVIKKIDTSKDGAMSKAYGDFFRFVLKYLDFDGKEDNVWQAFVSESGDISIEITGADFEYLIRSLLIEYISWKDFNVHSWQKKSIHTKTMKKMLIDYWHLIDKSLSNSECDYQDFLQVWAKCPLSVTFVHHLIKFVRMLK